jgi:tRNA A-37 threonylcarbamoyl transferase component Bud32
LSESAEGSPEAASHAVEPGSGGSGASSEFLKKLSQLSPPASRYKLQGEVARGGMGAILRVWDESLRRHLAMKVVLGKEDPLAKGATPPVDERTLARFLEEAQVTGQLDHPGVVPVYELGVNHEGAVYFTMRLVKGRSLGEIFALVREGAEGWNQTRALSALLKVCETMSYAHAKGVIHRDLKPANVMVGRYCEVYVMDWGLAKVQGQQDTHDLRLRPMSTSAVRSERSDLGRDTPDSPLITHGRDGDGHTGLHAARAGRGACGRARPARRRLRHRGDGVRAADRPDAVHRARRACVAAYGVGAAPARPAAAGARAESRGAGRARGDLRQGDGSAGW